MLSVIIGLLLLVIGSELLVRGASGLALKLGLPPLVIGLTIVAYGTSAPEVFVSAKAAIDGEGDIALGNVLGSNIFNILFILGLSALVKPLVIGSSLVRKDVPLMIVSTLVLLILAADGLIGP
ncbi:MAG: hypothetical protein JJU11_18490 [Candidatus Sumerlaeia bacterium]|nr:hypothetical protein [Candidatus Sumerlaeia bacterium]